MRARHSSAASTSQGSVPPAPPRVVAAIVRVPLERATSRKSNVVASLRLRGGVSSADRIWRPSASPSSGGTALPICLSLRLGWPANRNQSGKVWTRAASRTDSVRCCWGWMYQ